MLTAAVAEGRTKDGEDGVEMKSVLGDRLTTVFVRQGHYAREAIGPLIAPPPDLTIDRIDEPASICNASACNAPHPRTAPDTAPQESP